MLISRTILRLLISGATFFFSSCSDSQSPDASPDFSGSWRVLFVPAVNPSDPPVDSHALWSVTPSRGNFTAVIRYADTNYVPCNCPTDTLRGTVDGNGLFSGTAGVGSSITQIRDSVYEIVFTRHGEGTVGANGILTGEFRWNYSAGGDLPAGCKAGDIYKSWNIRGTRSAR